MIYQFESEKIDKCVNCPLFYQFDCSSFAVCGIESREVLESEKHKRPEWCPLVEVKEEA